ncbi:MAG TPA: prepilin-type N-terminal cleavage/methylation domain-containing protein [Candidatus Sumerlaeota bacterium]|nr:prepilin-type N-terminal cleavage/methylation domain-containing protein [Candidatus Sumerlaeota bacterium]HPS01003.1 prepilin-type N-terminal cleavage/methylation domain-containing protein [Candidatus Sumerlaeota bacterium]
MFSRHPGRSSSGFTLIEILVICAILAILSSILITNVRQQMEQAERKATFADARSVANALTTAQFDVGFYPRVGYLNFTVPELKLASGSPTVLPPSLDTMGFPDALLTSKIGTIYTEWGKGGSYLSFGAERASMAPGGSVGYLCKMSIPGLSSSHNPIKWPADPWGNPYVVYLIKIVDNQAMAGPGVVTSSKTGAQYSWISGPFDNPTYKALVVSYGPNGYPGGTADGKLPAGVTAEKILDDYGLFRRPATSTDPFTALRSTEINSARTSALSTDFGYSPGSGIVGIMDVGSDDIFQPMR